MPIYEYYCDACGHEFEVMQKISDKPIRKCEKCGRLKVKKKVSRTTFVLKGSGWYVTDYGGKNGSGPPKSDNKKETATESTDKSSTTDSKSAPAETKKAASA